MVGTYYANATNCNSSSIFASESTADTAATGKTARHLYTLPGGDDMYVNSMSSVVCLFHLHCKIKEIWYGSLKSRKIKSKKKESFSLSIWRDFYNLMWPELVPELS